METNPVAPVLETCGSCNAVLACNTSFQVTAAVLFEVVLWERPFAVSVDTLYLCAGLRTASQFSVSNFAVIFEALDAHSGDEM